MILFFVIAFVLTSMLVYVFAGSVQYTALLMLCSSLAVVWTLGLLVLTGFAIDPMSILVPFLVLAIAVSHGVQMVGAASAATWHGVNAFEGARTAFRQLIGPGIMALASDCAGFLTILIIDVRVIRDLALAMSLGVAVIVFTNLMLLPVLLSYARRGAAHRQRWWIAVEARTHLVWARLARLASWPAAGVVVAVALLLMGAGLIGARGYTIGDIHPGVPELRPDSRYNLDSAAVSDLFAIGVDVLTVIVEAQPDACIDFSVVDRIDDFAVRMAQVAGVQSTLSLPQVARGLNAGFNDGHLKWRVLRRAPATLVQSTGPIETGTGLLDADCSTMPVLIFTADHRAETIDRVVAAVADYAARHASDDLRFRLATGNLSVMAATNDLVRDAQFAMPAWIYLVIAVLCLAAFRSIRATLCVLLPLALVSTLTFALMAVLQIGLKISTLPVVALGVGIGVDYGIYVFSDLRRRLSDAPSLADAFRRTMSATGSAVLVTGLTLAVGVTTWIFSDLQFQADMGVMLAFMFLANMAGAILLIPALAVLFFGARPARP